MPNALDCFVAALLAMPAAYDADLVAEVYWRPAIAQLTGTEADEAVAV